MWLADQEFLGKMSTLPPSPASWITVIYFFMIWNHYISEFHPPLSITYTQTHTHTLSHHNSIWMFFRGHCDKILIISCSSKPVMMHPVSLTITDLGLVMWPDSVSYSWDDGGRKYYVTVFLLLEKEHWKIFSIFPKYYHFYIWALYCYRHLGTRMMEDTEVDKKRGKESEPLMTPLNWTSPCLEPTLLCTSSLLGN